MISLAWGRNEHGGSPPINQKSWGERCQATDVIGVKEGNKTFCQRHVEPPMGLAVTRTTFGQLPYDLAICLLFASIAPAAGNHHCSFLSVAHCMHQSIASSRAPPISFKMQERTLSRKSPRGHAKRTPSRRAFCAIVDCDDKSLAMSLLAKQIFRTNSQQVATCDY